MGTRARTALLAVLAPLVALALVEGVVALGRLVWLASGAGVLRVLRDRDGKPVVRLEGGELRVENVPVPRGAAGHRFVATLLLSRLEALPGFATAPAAAGGLRPDASGGDSTGP